MKVKYKRLPLGYCYYLPYPSLLFLYSDTCGFVYYWTSPLNSCRYQYSYNSLIPEKKNLLKE